MSDKEWYRAKLRSILARRLGEAPQQPCHYCQAQPGDWCIYDCGSPFPVLHPVNRTPHVHGAWCHPAAEGCPEMMNP